MRSDFLRPAWAIATGSIAAPTIATAGIATGRAFPHGGFHAAAAPLAIAMIAGAALMFSVAGWMRYWRDRPVERPIPDPNGSWAGLFGDMIRLIETVPDDVLARLDARYDGADDQATVNKAERAAWNLADWYSRTHTQDGAPTRAQGTLSRLFEESTGAYLAALAVLTRDVITLDQFETLTGPWVAEGLPLPGGPGMEHLTLRLEVPSGLPGQWTKIDEATLQGDGTAASAGQLAESLAGHALTDSPNVDIELPEWRLRVWAGLNADTDAPADGEYLHRDSDALVVVPA